MEITFKARLIQSNEQMLITIPKAFKPMMEKFQQTDDLNVYISDGHV